MAGLSGHFLDHYQIIEEIGRGGMATVCRAVDTHTKTEVAIKVLSPTMSGDSRFVQRFRRESSLLSGLDHPHIVPVIGYGESKGVVYMVMPFIRGDSLQSRLEQGRISKKERERWIEQIADALTFAHNQGIIHRDVKPSNVLINKNGNALLTDFGLAREVEGSNTLTGSMLLGTPAYMAPEQGRGDRVDERSDQYAFGVIVYQLLTKRLPFESDSPMGTVLKHIQEPVPRPTRFNPDISFALERVLLKCLAKDPEFRYPSVSAFYQAYKAAQEGASISDLNLDTVVMPLGTALRDERAGYRAEEDGVLPKAKRSHLWLLLITLLPLLLVAIFMSPRISPIIQAWLAGPKMTPSMPTEAGTAAEIASTIPPPSPTVRPTPISLRKEGCPAVKVYAPGFRSNDVIWTLENEKNEPAEFLVRLIFPAENARVAKISLGGVILWEGEGDQSDLRLGRLTIPPSSTTELSYEFLWKPKLQGYQLILDFGNDCILEGAW
jgi:serine/threonine protein kinase